MGAVSHGGTDARGFDKEFTRWTVPNVETLSGDKTITSVDARVQLLNPGGAARIVTLDASLHVEGTLIDIHATGESGYGIDVKNSAASLITRLIYDQSVKVVYASGAWRVINLPFTAELGSSRENLYLGYRFGVTNTYLSISSGHKVYVDANGVGIGATPSSLFHVTAAGKANALRVDDTTGNVAIGIAPDPTCQLIVSHTKTTDGARPFAVVQSNSSTGSIENYFHTSCSVTAYLTNYQDHSSGSACVKNYVATGNTAGDAYYTASINSGQAWAFGLDNSDSDKFKISASSALGTSDVVTITTTNYIGIGTSAPIWEFTIAKAAGPGIALVNTSNEGFIFGPVHAASNVYFTTNVAFGFIWQPNATAKMWLTSGGSWGLGATPSSLFHVSATGNANALRVDDTTGNVGIGNAPDASFQLAQFSGQAYIHNVTIGGYISQVGATMYAYDTGAVNTNKTWTLLGLDYAGSANITIVSYSALSGYYVVHVGSTARDVYLYGTVSCPSTTGAFIPNKLTTTQRDALTAVKGMTIYNTTTDKAQVYNGAWVDLH